jgi:hypothetical protein
MENYTIKDVKDFLNRIPMELRHPQLETELIKKLERVKMIKLKERYQLLGDLEDLFPRTSTHKAATEIKRLRDEALKEIEKLTSKKDG